MTTEIQVLCDAPSHARPVPLEVFRWREEFVDDWDGEVIPAGWAWDNGRKSGGGKLDYATREREHWSGRTHETVHEFEGRQKIALDCRKCGLHLPMRWETWTNMLDQLRRAGVTSVNLPALVATMTK